MGRMLQEAVSSQLGVLEEEVQLEDRLSQVRSRAGIFSCLAPFSVWVLECCIGFGIEPIHRALLTKPGRGWLPVPIRAYCLAHHPPLRRYLLLNRNGTASQVESTSRNFNPVAIFNELKFVRSSITKLRLMNSP